MKYSESLEKRYKKVFAGDAHMLSLLGVNPEVLDRALFELSYSGISNEQILKASSLGKLKEHARRSLAIQDLRTKLWEEYKHKAV